MTHTVTDPDVAIVGTGVMGLSLAWALARRGRRVLCLDRSAPGREASAATAGTLAVQNKPLGSIPLTLRSLKIWRDLSRDLEWDVEYEVRGGLRIAETPEDVDKLLRSAESQRAAGAPIEVVHPPRLFELAPYLSPGVSAATFCPQDGMANPFAVVRGLFRACRRDGVLFELHRAVERVVPGSGGSVRIVADGLTVESGVAVVAAGAWIPVVAANLGAPLPIVARVQQVLITDFGRSLFPHVVTHVRGNLTLKQQEDTGKVLVGGGWPGIGDDSRTTRRLSRDSIAGNARAAVAAIPALARARLLRAWTGFEGRSPDKLPLIGPLPGVPNVHVLGCASGGLTLAPACGLLLAQRLTGEVPDLPLEPFAPGRFRVAFWDG